MIRVSEVLPGISETRLRQVSELLACVSPNPEIRTAQRRRKLETFPADDREEIRELANRVILARRK